MDYSKLSLELHKKLKGKIEIKSKISLKNKDDLSIAYTPGVAEPCLEIKNDEKKVYDLTSNANTVAVVSDGSAVLGLGDIGPKASLPVMEGKAVLFKEFAGIDSFPIVIDTKNVNEFVKTVKNIAPSFGGINLEDISSPRCFEIEERLKKELDIPVFHDDQHGTAIVVLAGLINSLKIIGKKKEDLKIVINGSGAAGIAIGRLLCQFGVKQIIFCDSKGIISKQRLDLNDEKKMILEFSNKNNMQGDLSNAIECADVFIGVSIGNILKEKHVKSMNKDPIIFAMANPIPEINPDIAQKFGARIVATGRSDYPNQINNVLVFPGIFKGAMKAKCQITDKMKLNAAYALANIIKRPTEDRIIPTPFDKKVVEAVSKSVENN